MKKTLILGFLFILILSSFASAATVDFDTYAEVYTPFYNFSNGVDGLEDISGNGNNATAYNGVTFNTEKTMYEFSDASDYVKTVGYEPPLNEFTISTWVTFPSVANSAAIYSTLSTSSGRRGLTLYLDKDAGGVRFRFFTWVTASFDILLDFEPPSAITTDTLYNVIVTCYDNGGSQTCDGYVNGSYRASDTDADTMTSHMTGLQYGKYYGDATTFGGLVSIGNSYVLNYSINETEAVYLHSLGKNYDPFAIPFINTSNFSITANLNNYTANITNDLFGYSQVASAATGSNKKCAAITVNSPINITSVSFSPSTSLQVNITLMNDTVIHSSNDDRTGRSYFSPGITLAPGNYKVCHNPPGVYNQVVGGATLDAGLINSTITGTDWAFKKIYFNVVHKTTDGDVFTKIPRTTKSTEGLYNIDLTINHSQYKYYDNLSISNRNVSSNWVATFVKQRSLITVNTKDLLNNTVNGFTLTSDIDTNTSGSVIVEHGSNVSINWSKAGWFNKNYNYLGEVIGDRTVTISDVYDQIINITANAAITGTPLTSFNGVVNSSGYSFAYSSTSSFAEIPAITNHAYTIYWNKTGYTSNTTTLTTNATTVYNYNLIVWSFNSILLNIRNASNQALITQAVDVFVKSNSHNYANTTSSGSLYLKLLTPENYELRLRTSGFLNRSIFLNVANDSTQNVTVYLEEDNNNTVIRRVNVIDLSSSVVEGATVILQKEILNNTEQWLTISEGSTDSEGQTYISIIPDPEIFYRFGVKYENVAREIEPNGNVWTTKTSFLSSVDEIVQLQINTGDGTTNTYLPILDGVITSLIITNDTNYYYYNFSWLDGSNAISGARIRVTGQYTNISLEEQSIGTNNSNSFGGTLTYRLPIINNTRFSLYGEILYNNNYYIYESAKLVNAGAFATDKNNGLLYAAIIFIFVIFLTYKLGAAISGTIGVLVLAGLTIAGIIAIGVSIITSLIALFLILFLKPGSKGGE